MGRGRHSSALPAASLHLILALLHGELHGYALMHRVEELSDGAIRIGPGTLYGTIRRLVEDGLVVETTQEFTREPGDRRRFYRLTEVGDSVAHTELARLRLLLARLAGDRSVFDPGSITLG
jgi:DNA-binding PadR family transcriptional regulator